MTRNGWKLLAPSRAVVMVLAWFAVGAAPAPGDLAVPAVAPDHATTMERGLELFRKDVRLLLTDHCVKCHGGATTKAELDLTTREGLLRGGAEGPAVVPGKAGESFLYQLIAHAEEPRMPLKAKKLPDEAIARIGAWIDAGAPYDGPLVGKDGPIGARKVGEEDRQFWSFLPLASPEPPKVRDEGWCRTPVDRFILARLEAQGLAPGRPADRRTLIRRASFDLIGLPPSPEEVEAFVIDPSPVAYEALVDRLLNSPHHGERWGRHWLDLARFAESHGYEQDYDRKHAYHYRDFVIRALNADMPYDRFVQLQIAGDEIEPESPLAMMATGFLGAGTHATQITANQVEKERYDELDDMTATVGTAMLGVTIGCARCHDHKYDPIPQGDYYRMLSTFTTAVRSEIDLDFNPDQTRCAKLEFDRRHAPLVEALAEYEAKELPGRLPRPLRAGGTIAWPRLLVRDPARARGWTEPLLDALRAGYRVTDPGWVKLSMAVRESRRGEPKPAMTKVMVTSEGLPAIRFHTQGADFFEKAYFLKRGDPNQKQGEASQGFLQALTRTPEGPEHWRVEPPKGSRTSYRRTSLARWLTDVDRGAGHLLARVIVNRLWQHHFGKGIVATPSDFGKQGGRPSHPELLDWLAGELIRGGWRLKPIHKLIMTGAVYREGAEADSALAAADPDNTLYGRWSRRRLEAEAIRDAMLAVGGGLDATMFGPGTLDEGHRRRSVYFTIKRSQLIPVLTLFDAPDSLQGLAARSSTTIAPQALMLLNNPQVREYARAFAARLLPAAGAGTPPAEAIERAYRIALSRPPHDDERDEALAFVRQQADSYRAAGQAEPLAPALADFCQVLMGLNEFIYIE